MAEGCGEIKCPATLQLYSESPKHARHGMPHYHYDQVQGQMKLLNVAWCDYVVYTPAYTQVTRIAFSATYWDTELFPALRAFYFHEFLPRLRLRHAGKLPRGEVDPLIAPLPWLAELCTAAPVQDMCTAAPGHEKKRKPPQRRKNAYAEDAMTLSASLARAVGMQVEDEIETE